MESSKGVYLNAVCYVHTLMNTDKIAKLHSQVIQDNVVHLNATLLDIIGAQENANCVVTFLSPIKHVA